MKFLTNFIKAAATLLMLSNSVNQVMALEVNHPAINSIEEGKSLDTVEDVLEVNDTDLIETVTNQAIIAKMDQETYVYDCRSLKNGYECKINAEIQRPGRIVVIYKKDKCVWATTGKVNSDGRTVSFNKKESNAAPADGDFAVVSSGEGEVISGIKCSFSNDIY